MKLSTRTRFIKWGFIFSISAQLISCASIKGLGTDTGVSSEVYNSFEGRYIDQIEKGQWVNAITRDLANGKQNSKPVELSNAYLPKAGITIARLETSGILDVPETTRYLESIAARLLKVSPKTGVPVKILITSDSGYGDAKQAPGGTLMIPLGFFKNAGSEDEVAWMLAHELSHTILNHHDSDWVKKYQKRAGGIASLVADLAKAVDKMKSKMTGEEATKVEDSVKEFLKVVKIARETLSIGLLPAWERRHEDEADLLAQDLVIQAGYNGSQSDVVLAGIQDWSGSQSKLVDEIFSTLEESVNTTSKQGLDSMLAGFEIPNQKKLLNMAIDTAKKQIREYLKDWAQRTHHMAERRREDLKQYRLREYADADVIVEANAENFARERNTAHYDQVKELYDRVWDLNDMMRNENLRQDGNNENFDKLVAGFEKTLKTMPAINKYDSSPRVLFSKIRSRQGEARSAIKNLEFAISGPQPTFKVYEHLTELYHGQHRYKDAQKLIDEARKEFDDPPMLYPINIKQHLLAGDPGTASILVNQCKLNAIAQADSCETAFNDHVNR